MAFASVGGVAGGPLAGIVRAAAAQIAARANGEGSAEIAVAFDHEGRVLSAALRRSTGSKPTDAAARDEALQLASLQPPGRVAGRTLVFRARFGLAFE